MGPTEELGMLMGRARRKLWSAASKSLEDSGDSLMTWQVLSHLARVGSSAQSDLAYATAQHPAGLSRLLDELETSGLVLRERDDADRRRVLVALSPRGKAKVQAMRPAMIAAAERCFAPLSPKERTTLREILTKLVEGKD